MLSAGQISTPENEKALAEGMERFSADDLRVAREALDRIDPDGHLRAMVENMQLDGVLLGNRGECIEYFMRLGRAEGQPSEGGTPDPSAPPPPDVQQAHRQVVIHDPNDPARRRR